MQPVLPQLHVPLHLQRAEVCHYAAPAVMQELRTETRRVVSGGPLIRIRIFKGFSYRLGSSSSKKIKEDVLQEIDRGTLYVTNQRVIFDGERKNTILRFDDILAVMPHESGGVEIDKTSGRSPIFVVADPDWLTTLLTGLLTQSS